ncbi:cyclase family protein [Gracilibacillus sp. D59]|uniref:cyclase family protein n=1 Tax=Gracilibacillus sp. D59 TaxID=3457434 RepID=UPI003FCC94F6
MSRINNYGKLTYPVFSPELITLIKKGKIYSLQHSLEAGIPVIPGHSPFSISSYFRHHDTDNTFDGPAGAAAEMVIMGQHTGTHIDALCHFSKKIGDQRYFHGNKPVAGAENENGIQTWSVDQMPPLVKRGVLLDIAGFLGVEVLEDSYVITKKDIYSCLKNQNIQLKSGDCVLLRTGCSMYWKKDNERFLTKHAGVNLESARYLVEQGATVVGGDTPTFEVLPSPKHDVHVYLLVEQGVPIIENVCLDELAQDRIYEFVLIATPLKLKGATASIIHPIAIC